MMAAKKSPLGSGGGGERDAAVRCERHKTKFTHVLASREPGRRKLTVSVRAIASHLQRRRSAIISSRAVVDVP